MRNRYAGKCRDCGINVAEGAGYFHKRTNARGFDVRCIVCVAQGKQARGDELTPPQRQALVAIAKTTALIQEADHG